jgi:hypothetical protein
MFVSCMDCKLSVLEKHHFCSLLFGIDFKNSLKDAVDLEIIAGLLTDGTDPFGIG